MKDRQEMSWLLKAILEYYRVIWKTVERGKVDGYRKGVLDKYIEGCGGGRVRPLACSHVGERKEGWNEKNIVNYDIPRDSLYFPVITNLDSIHLPLLWAFCTFKVIAFLF